MTDINLGVCSNSPFPNANILEDPGPCSAGRSLKYIDKHTKYKGPFINLSFSNIPSHEVRKTPSHVLSALSVENIPVSWSWRQQGKKKIEDGRRNQGNCGCCWAMSFVSALGDRYAIKHNIDAPYPSVMWMVSCGGSKIGSKGESGSFLANQQCRCGGSTYAAGKWMEEGNSIGLESCWPFSTISNNNVAPNCPNVLDDCCSDCCGNTDSKVKFTIEKDSTKCIVIADSSNNVDIDATIRAIKSNIKKNGPIVTTFWVPSKFEDWWNTSDKDNEIYVPNEKTIIGENGHSVVLTGWGNENNIDFWEMRNSWGSPGYCKFAMSSSTNKEFWCGIDIPEFNQGAWQGGTISFLPGELSEHNWTKSSDSDSDSDFKLSLSNNNWILIGIGIAVILVFIFILLVL